VVGDWMLRLPERVDHEGRLLPFLLAGMVDEGPQVRARACVMGGAAPCRCLYQRPGNGCRDSRGLNPSISMRLRCTCPCRCPRHEGIM
jgi:hypothetical protein